MFSPNLEVSADIATIVPAAMTWSRNGEAPQSTKLAAVVAVEPEATKTCADQEEGCDPVGAGHGAAGFFRQQKRRRTLDH
jgi:hypothetical protein